MSDQETSEKAAGEESEPGPAPEKDTRGGYRTAEAPSTVPTVEPSPIARAAFPLVWYGLVPLAIAQSRVFILAAFPEGGLAETVRGQPIPVSIVP